MTVFILEDNKNLSETLKRQLTNAGYRVTTALSWQQATLSLKETFDIFIIDFVLPDIQGGQAMENILKQGINKSSQFILISGIFSEQRISEKIPKELKSQTTFMKKPFNSKELIETIQKLKTENRESSEVFSNSFFSPTLKEGNLNQTMNSHCLIDILLSFNRKKFNGNLILKSSSGGESAIEFYNGEIIKVVSASTPSYFGQLLVEHGFSLQKEIEEVLAVKEKKYIGQILIEKGLISPHMVNFILKEQAKIRLSELISEHSFRIKIVNKTPEVNNSAVTEFNRTEIIDWAVECIKTKLNDFRLKSFYLTNRTQLLQALSPVRDIVQKNKDFLKQYNKVFKHISGEITIEKLFEKTNLDQRLFSELIYFGVAVQSIRIFDSKADEQRLKKISDLVEVILTQKTTNLFDILNLPWKASTTEVKEKHKAIIKFIHPDNLPSHCSKDLQNKCEQAIRKINGAYDILSDNKKREEYLEKKQKHSFSNTMALYEKGLEFLKMKNYEEALKALQPIKNAPFCPNNICLYILWAEIQAFPEKLKNKEKAGVIRQKIGRSPLELRISPLFWFVNGLFYSNVEQYEKAVFFFKKTLQFDKHFTEASRELLKTSKKIKEKLARDKKPFFQKIFPFKKSG